MRYSKTFEKHDITMAHVNVNVFVSMKCKHNYAKDGNVEFWTQTDLIHVSTTAPMC